MFLNWVYRRNSYGDMSDPCTEAQGTGVGVWDGFHNVLDNNGSPDVELSGNNRYFWMEDQIVQIASEQGW